MVALLVPRHYRRQAEPGQNGESQSLLENPDGPAVSYSGENGHGAETSCQETPVTPKAQAGLTTSRDSECSFPTCGTYEKPSRGRHLWHDSWRG